MLIFKPPAAGPRLEPISIADALDAGIMACRDTKRAFKQHYPRVFRE